MAGIYGQDGLIGLPRLVASPGVLMQIAQVEPGGRLGGRNGEGGP